MGSVALQSPGEKYGPCEDACTHEDCAETRAMSEKPCRICGEPIGYGNDFFQEQDWKVLVHADCRWMEARAD